MDEDREHALYGARVMPGGDMYEHHQAFIEWASQYDTEAAVSRTKQKHLEWLAKLPCKVIKLDSSVSLQSLIQQATQALKL